MRWRIIVVIFCFAGAYALLTFNIYYRQIAEHDKYVNLAAGQNASNGLLAALRGSIFFTDKFGNTSQAAINKDYPEVFAVPAEIQKYYGSSTEELSQAVQSEAEQLAGVLGLAPDDIKNKLSKMGDQYELLLKKMTPSQADSVQNLSLVGIHITDEPRRFYPYGSLASQVLGFVSPANESEAQKSGDAEIGRYGVELYANQELSGAPGQIEGDTATPAENGQDIALTIDPTIQGQAETILSSLIQKYQASGGSVIVEEPKTGKILAMGSFPNFDPNNYSQSAVENFMNPAAQGVYEPGSIFKLLTMAAGIDSGKITPDSKYYDTGTFTANGKTISNWDLKKHGPWGQATMTNVIEHSINTGAVFAERKTGPDIFYNYLIKFRVNQPTGITLPGEVHGSINNLRHGRDIDFATAAYGQGVSITPLGLITAISSIANHGVMMKPYILASNKPQVITQPISQDTAQKITQMMVSAVYVNKVAVIPDYDIAGKTGTAFIPNFGGKGYTDQVINTYIGFGPASDPQFIILVKLDKPAGSPLAGESVVPAFKQLAQFIINYLNIPPDHIQAQNN